MLGHSQQMKTRTRLELNNWSTEVNLITRQRMVDLSLSLSLLHTPTHAHPYTHRINVIPGIDSDQRKQLVKTRWCRFPGASFVLLASPAEQFEFLRLSLGFVLLYVWEEKRRTNSKQAFRQSKEKRK